MRQKTRREFTVCMGGSLEVHSSFFDDRQAQTCVLPVCVRREQGRKMPLQMGGAPSTAPRHLPQHARGSGAAACGGSVLVNPGPGQGRGP